MFFRPLTPVVKNLIIINALMFLATQALQGTLGGWMEVYLSGHWFTSPLFRPWQIITHMFMHANFQHILFNMFGVYVFGVMLEQMWGAKRFLTYYMLSGLGAVALHFLFVYFRLSAAAEVLTPEQIAEVLSRGHDLLLTHRNYVDVNMAHYNSLLNGGMLGASGALFGLILAFGLLFPNLQLMLLFPPIPIRARWLAFGYAAFEIFSAFGSPNDGVAHFAHLGGMIAGYIVLKYWQKKGMLH
ncbi:MAG: rhomboid family intramembrane serine protease [Flavobacteriales bacterium]|nr:rhomboid family intramembrane serine protease [Flavobacteriales bacterium]